MRCLPTTNAWCWKLNAQSSSMALKISCEERPDRSHCVRAHESDQPEEERDEEEFWKSFRADQHLILGSVLDAVVGGLRELPGVKLERMPRAWLTLPDGELPSAAAWVGSRMPFSLRTRRTGLKRPSRRSTARRWGSFLLSLAGGRSDFEQSPTELLEVLTQHAEERGKSLAGWPKSARALTNELRRIAPQMRMHGVSIIMKRTNQGRRVRLVTGRYRACTEATADTDLAENPSI